MTSTYMIFNLIFSFLYTVFTIKINVKLRKLKPSCLIIKISNQIKCMKIFLLICVSKPLFTCAKEKLAVIEG